jgi:hypothetical protein
MRKYLWAWRDLDAALKETRQPLTEEQRGQIKKLIEQSRAFIGSFRLVLEPSNATVEVDEKAAELESNNVLLLEIGEHEIVARAPEYQEVKQAVTVEGGEDKELRLTLEQVAAAPPPVPVVVPAPQEPAAKAVSPKPAPKPEESSAASKAQKSPEKKSSGPTWAWATVGISALTGIGAAGFWILGDKRFNELKRQCSGFQCSENQAKDGKKEVEQLDKLATIFVGVSISFAALSVVLFIVESIGGSEDKAEVSKATGVTPSFGIKASTLQLEGRF